MMIAHSINGKNVGRCLVSGGIRLMRIFAEVPLGGDSGLVENVNFQRFRWLFFGNFIDYSSVIIIAICTHRQLFSDPKMHDLE